MQHVFVNRESVSQEQFLQAIFASYGVHSSDGQWQAMPQEARPEARPGSALHALSGLEEELIEEQQEAATLEEEKQRRAANVRERACSCPLVSPLCSCWLQTCLLQGAPCPPDGRSSMTRIPRHATGIRCSLTRATSHLLGGIALTLTFQILQCSPPLRHPWAIPAAPRPLHRNALVGPCGL